MGLVKVLVLVSAITATMAFADVSLATAGNTLLCSKNTASLTPSLAECEPPKELHFLTVTATGTKDGKKTFLNSTLSISCEALFTGTILDQKLVEAGPVRVAGNLIYKNCTFGCTLTVVKQGVFLLLKSGPELVDFVGDEFELRMNCFGFFDCYYNMAGGLVGHGHSFGAGGLLHITYSEDVVNLVKGSSCPAVAKLDALFQSLKAIYIRS